LTLEHLEATFYAQGLANFSNDAFTAAGFSTSIRDHVVDLAADEATHVSFLTTALTAAGAQPVAACTYDFGVTDVTTFLATAAILEGVGVSAYLGAAADIMSKAYLTAAGSILTVEARHSSYLREVLGEEGFPAPFDAPLDLDEVYTLAAAFIVICPSTNAALPVQAFPELVEAPTNPAVIQTGTTITLLTPGYVVLPADGVSPVYAAFITVTGPVFAVATPVAGGFTVVVPGTAAGSAPINGQTYIVLTSCNKAVTDATIAAGPAIIEVSN
jgi:hypothetical protein